ncbi:hypothetical protein C0Q70_07639 [Pomacea canaliculata]|uniref:Carbohydrate sulfotransferase n=1 Tax=Pomacea canaliculata TaxID=400727 RepID=A0A2T7PFQ7_POMCA|nr:hypothetical protein C0Q70_07639 [Pomacea canaliculata]
MFTSIPPDKAIRVREKYSAYKTLKEFNSAQREKQFLDGLTRVVFVRHPLWRLWSLYVDKLVFPNPYYWRVWGMPAQRRSAVLSAGPGLTGDNFVTRDANRSKHLQNLSPKAPTDLQASRPKEPHRKRSDKKELGLSTDFRLNVSQGDLRDCGQNVRFSEFLDFALEDLHEADWHVRPVSEQCAPCLTDLREVMRELEVPVGESSWQEAVAVDAIKEGVSSLFDKWWFEATRCVSAELAARRLWRTFQLRGFLSQTAPFPFSGEGRRVIDARMLEEAALRARASSSFARERQKALAFRRAVQDVDDRVLKRLADKYSADFAMFGFTLTNSL